MCKLLLTEKFVVVQKIGKKVNFIDPTTHFHFPEVTFVVVSCVSFYILFVYIKPFYVWLLKAHIYVELQCIDFFYNRKITVKFFHTLRGAIKPENFVIKKRKNWISPFVPCMILWFLPIENYTSWKWNLIMIFFLGHF